ncbi:zinc finger, CCHC-type containing protein [Tanacetum coccineum]
MSSGFRFFVIEPNDSVVINLIIESRDAIFDENIFSSVPRPSLRIPNETEDIGGSVVPVDVTKKVVQQPEPELRKSKRNTNPKNFEPEFQLYLIEGTRDEVSDQHSYFFNVEDDPKHVMTANELVPRMLLTSWLQKDLQIEILKAFLNGDWMRRFIMNQPQGFIMPGNKNKVCKLIKTLYRLKQAPKKWHQKFDEVVLSNGYLLNQADKCVYSKFNESVLLMGLGRYTSNSYSAQAKNSAWSMRQVWIFAQQLRYSSTSGWTGFMLGGGMLLVWGVEWLLKNLLLKIPLWSNPIALFIRGIVCSTLAKAYSQMYNGKSRHLGVRHSMIRELITNEVISMEFVRSQQNLVDHLTKGLARDLV